MSLGLVEEPAIGTKGKSSPWSCPFRPESRWRTHQSHIIVVSCLMTHDQIHLHTWRTFHFLQIQGVKLAASLFAASSQYRRTTGPKRSRMGTTRATLIRTRGASSHRRSGICASGAALRAAVFGFRAGSSNRASLPRRKDPTSKGGWCNTQHPRGYQ